MGFLGGGGDTYVPPATQQNDGAAAKKKQQAADKATRTMAYGQQAKMVTDNIFSGAMGDTTLSSGSLLSLGSKLG